MPKKSDMERSDELLEEVGHLPEPTDLPDDDELADLFDDVEDAYCEECGTELDLDGECPECVYGGLFDDDNDDRPRRDLLDYDEDDS